MNLARSSYLGYWTALELTKYLKHENAYAPWKAAINNFQYLDTLLETESEYFKFRVIL